MTEIHTKKNGNCADALYFHGDCFLYKTANSLREQILRYTSLYNVDNAGLERCLLTIVGEAKEISQPKEASELTSVCPGCTVA